MKKSLMDLTHDVSVGKAEVILDLTEIAGDLDDKLIALQDNDNRMTRFDAQLAFDNFIAKLYAGARKLERLKGNLR